MARDLIPGDVTIRSIKAGDSRARLSDGDGLYLRLFVKGGSHGWRLDYTIAGVRKTLSLGTYPDTGLALARRKAEDARKLVSAGTDPSDVRKAAKAEAVRLREVQDLVDAGLPAVDSFEAVAREWLVMHATKVSEGQAERTRIRMEREVFPWLGHLPLASIKAPALLECLRRVEARGAVDTAHRVKQACGQVFRYGIATGRCERDWSADLRDSLASRGVKRHHPAITDPKRVGELLRALDAYMGHPVTRAALQLAPLVFQRPGELRRAEWAEMDLDAGVWTIAAARMKRTKQGKATGADHVVPLAVQAVAVLRDLQPLTGHARYVFPSARTDARPMSDNAVLSALRRMNFPKDEMTGHGFRAMARTMLAERLGVDESVIEAQLAHDVSDSLGRAYNRTTFMEQRRTMMQTWADYLDRLRKGADVVPIRERTG